MSAAFCLDFAPAFAPVPPQATSDILSFALSMNSPQTIVRLGNALDAYAAEVCASENCPQKEGAEMTMAFVIGFFHAQGLSWDELKACVEEARHSLASNTRN